MQSQIRPWLCVKYTDHSQGRIIICHHHHHLCVKYASSVLEAYYVLPLGAPPLPFGASVLWCWS